MADIINSGIIPEENITQSEVQPVVLSQPVTVERIREARQILSKYKKGKQNLEDRIVNNEQWMKLRHWSLIRTHESDVEPTSAWLLNTIQSKHADAMDAFPSANFLPREEGDIEEAKNLSSIIPCILDQNNFEGVYSDCWMYKLKNGMAVYAATWDKNKANGLGDIAITKVDVLNIIWQPGITDIQDSRNVFTVSLMDNDIAREMFPDLPTNPGDNSEVKKYIYDESIDTSDKVVVIDWYYKVNRNGRTILHYCKFIEDKIIFASENDPKYQERGYYWHGRYPFVIDTYIPEEGTISGLGIVDICKNPQEFIDKLNQGILKNALMGASPRFLMRNDGGVNEKELSDWTKPIIHVNANLNDDNFRQVIVNPPSSVIVQVLHDKVDEMKETSGNRDVNNGGTSAGVTAASAIAAMQEQSGKLSRDTIKASYRAFRQLMALVVELIRQYYDLPRKFRILGEAGATEFVEYDNSKLVPQRQGDQFGVDMGFRLPEFDIEITAQKASPYSKMAQNELMLQLYQLGIFNPQNVDTSCLFLEQMDFQGKDTLIQKLREQGGMFQQMLQMAQTIDQLTGSTLAAALMGESGASGGGSAQMNEVNPDGTLKQKEHAFVRNAREKAEAAHTPT